MTRRINDGKRSHPSHPLYHPATAPISNPANVEPTHFSELDGEISDSQVPESAVTQHEGALEIDLAQIADWPADLDDLADVDAASPSDGQVLTWDSTTSKWVAETPSGGGGGGASLEPLPMVHSKAASMYVALPASAIWSTEVPTTFTIEFMLAIWNFSSFGGPLALGTGGDSYILYTLSSGITSYPQTMAGNNYQPQRDGRAHRWSLVRTGGATVKCYIDGLFVEDLTLSTSAAISLSGTQRRLMGDGGGEGMNNQALADLRIWSDQRTAQEIYDNAFVRLTGSESDLVAYWPMDEGTGTTVSDLGPSNWDGTINGTHIWNEVWPIKTVENA